MGSKWVVRAGAEVWTWIRTSKGIRVLIHSNTEPSGNVKSHGHVEIMR